MEIVKRVVKAAIFAAVMFGAVWSLSGSVKTGLIAALIPLVLGSLAILSGVAYGLVALAVIAAVFWHVLPSEWTSESRRLLGNFKTQIDKEAPR